MSGALFLSPVGAAGRTYLIRVNPRQFAFGCGPLFSVALSHSPTSCLQQDTRRILVIHMTAALAHIVEEIAVLTPGEKIELRRHIVERVPWSPDLDEDDYAALSAASFRALDEEEGRGA